MFAKMFRRKQDDEELTLDTPDTAYSKSYSVVVSSSTLNDSQWNGVVSHLFSLHSNAVLLVYSKGDPSTIQSDLQSMMPRYVAFVCRPEECGRVFVAQCHRLMRSLNNDPYIDAMWAIVTGSDAEHALKSIDNESVPQPFVIQHAINFTNVEQDLFERCFTFSDAKQGCWYGKNCTLSDESGEEKEKGDQYPREPALIFNEKFHELEPDLLITSGHGTEHSVEMPWSVGKLAVQQCGLASLDHNDKPVAPVIEFSTKPKFTCRSPIVSLAIAMVRNAW